MHGRYLRALQDMDNIFLQSNPDHCWMSNIPGPVHKTLAVTTPPNVMITKNNLHKFSKCTLEGGAIPTETH